MNAVTVSAHHREDGWELRIDGAAATRATRLDRADRQVRDYLDALDPGTDHADWEVDIVPQLGPLGERVHEAREATRAADAVLASAATTVRGVVHALRAERVSLTDTAVILGIPRWRVAQLVESAARVPVPRVE